MSFDQSAAIVSFDRCEAMEKPTAFWRKDSGIELDDRYEKTTTFFDLPAEIRSSIYSLVFNAEESYNAAFCPSDTEPDDKSLCLQPDYWASDHLLPLLTCRTFYTEAHLLAFSKITFAIRNPYTALAIPSRLSSRLHPSQISSIRNIAVVSEARHFRQMHHWQHHAFAVPELQLDELTIVLHKSSYWHYLFDFNVILTTMFRDFRGVQRVRFVRNQARVKPHFHTWFNRFCGAMLALDRRERFCGSGEERVERTWWGWEFDGEEQSATLRVREAKPKGLDLGTYEREVEGMVKWLEKSVEAEEYDTDPMSRVGFV